MNTIYTTYTTTSTSGDTILRAVVLLFTYYINWQMYEKMEIEGWKALIPFYSAYVLFDKVYGNGWKMFMVLIPFYGIYVLIKFYMDLSKGFGKEPVFGLGLLFLNTIFVAILAFDDSEWNQLIEAE